MKKVDVAILPQVDARPPWPWVVAAVYVVVALMIVLFCHGDDIFNRERSPGAPPAARSP
jgi:hypothetical protein